MPELSSLLNKTDEAVFTFNNSRMLQILRSIAINAYPGIHIPTFTLEMKQKTNKRAHGLWYYPTAQKPISKIVIFNLNRKFEHTLSTTIHELAHHCQYTLENKTDHNKGFYTVLQHLLNVAHDLGYININETYDEFDTADRKRLIKYFGPQVERENKKPDIDFIKILAPKHIATFANRGYIYSDKEKVWICKLNRRVIPPKKSTI